jgi:hypothetical protein
MRIFTSELEHAKFLGTDSQPSTLNGSPDELFSRGRIYVNTFGKSSARGCLPPNAAKPSSLPTTLPNSNGEHQIYGASRHLRKNSLGWSLSTPAVLIYAEASSLPSKMTVLSLPRANFITQSSGT